MILFVLCAIAVAMILSHTPFGVAVRMIGSNERATRYSGVNTERVLVGVYALSSLLCCVAALVMMARFNSARAGYAESYLLITILGFSARRSRPIRRIRQGSGPLAFAIAAPSHLDRF